MIDHLPEPPPPPEPSSGQSRHRPPTSFHLLGENLTGSGLRKLNDVDKPLKTMMASGGDPVLLWDPSWGHKPVIRKATKQEMGMLQEFPADWPLAGGLTAQRRQSATRCRWR